MPCQVIPDLLEWRHDRFTVSGASPEELTCRCKVRSNWPRRLDPVQPDASFLGIKTHQPRLTFHPSDSQTALAACRHALLGSGRRLRMRRTRLCCSCWQVVSFTLRLASRMCGVLAVWASVCRWCQLRCWWPAALWRALHRRWRFRAPSTR